MSVLRYCLTSRNKFPIIFIGSYLFSKQYRSFISVCPKLNFNVNSRIYPKRMFCVEKSELISCSKCGKKFKSSSFRCPHCKHFLTPKVNQTYFELFEEKEKYKLDEEQLKQKFRYLQSEYHPDKFATKGDHEISISEDVSSFINKAYSTLTNPYERGVYLLKLNGIEMSESDSQLDKEFLLEVMELNDEVENTKDNKQLTKLELENDKRIKMIANEVAKAFKSKDYKEAKSQLQKMKYFISLRNRLRERKLKL